MSLFRHVLFPSTLLAGLALVASAQGRPGGTFARYAKPLQSVTLDLATGTLTRGSLPANRVGTTVTDFDNMDLGGFAGVDTGGSLCEWFDAGVKGTGMGRTAGVSNDSDLMNSILFAYCSARLDTRSGGPGGSVKLGFYEGYTTFGGASTTAVSVFTLTGLPANSRSSSFFGGFNCYVIRVIFSPLVCFADGPIGYSWKFLDAGTGTIHPRGAVLAGTWPFLSCVASCSATCLTVDLQGMDNVIDRYCPPGSLLPPGTFCFGTTSGTFTSIAMSIEEVVDKTATVSSFNSTAFPNPDVLTGVPAIVGQPWSASLTLGFGRPKGASSWILYFGTTLLNPPTGIPVPRISGGINWGTNRAGKMLLCTLDSGGFSCVGSHTGVSGSQSTTNCGGGSIPKTINLVCNSWCAQAVVLGFVAAADGGGNGRMSSAIRGVIGAF